MGSSWTRDQTGVPCIARQVLTLDHRKVKITLFLKKILLIWFLRHHPLDSHTSLAIYNLIPYWFYLISWLLNFRGCPGSMLEYLSTFTWWSHLISWQEVSSLSSLLQNLCLSFPWTTDSYNTSFARTKSLESSWPLHCIKILICHSLSFRVIWKLHQKFNPFFVTFP